MSDRASLITARELVGLHHDELNQSEYALFCVYAIRGLLAYTQAGFVAWSDIKYAAAARKALN